MLRIALQKDKVIAEKLVHQPKFIGAVFLICFALFFLFNLTDTAFGKLLAPVIGDTKEAGFYGRFVVSFTLSLLLCLNFILIACISAFRVQVIIVWLELTSMFMGFFYLFDLSWAFIQSKLWFLISQGVLTTLYVSAISIALAFIIAIFGAIAKLSSNGFAYAISSFYTSFFRGLPLLMLVYLIYLGLPQLGYTVGAIPAGIAALSLCYGAYMTEIFRAGIESISRGQWEGARALGFKFSSTMRLIILPQSIPLIIPPTGNQFIAMLKDSSLVSVIGVWELMFLAKKLGAKTFQHLEMLITVAVIYWLMTIVLEAIQARIETHYRRKKQ